MTNGRRPVRHSTLGNLTSPGLPDSTLGTRHSHFPAHPHTPHPHPPPPPYPHPPPPPTHPHPHPPTLPPTPLKEPAASCHNLTYDTLACTPGSRTAAQPLALARDGAAEREVRRRDSRRAQADREHARAQHGLRRRRE